MNKEHKPHPFWRWLFQLTGETNLKTILNRECSSVGGIRGVGNQSGYAASKHGVVGLTRNSGIEYGQYGVSVKAIALGAIMTPMVEGSLKQIDPVNWGKKSEKHLLNLIQ